MDKKRIITILIICLLCMMLVSCRVQQPDRTELTVFAASSLSEALTEIAESYTAEHPEVTFSFNFDSSGTLKTQIEQGAECDLFLSASPKQMDELREEFTAQEDRIDLLENQVVLCTSNEEDCPVHSFDELKEHLNAGAILLAIGDGDVPAGQYASKIFDYYGISEQDIAQSLTYGSNVKAVTTAVAEAAADCGIVYATDAFSAELTVIDEATEEMCGKVLYPAAVLKTSQNHEQARAFLEYLKTDAAKKVFESVGFTALN